MLVIMQFPDDMRRLHGNSRWTICTMTVVPVGAITEMVAKVDRIRSVIAQVAYSGTGGLRNRGF